MSGPSRQLTILIPGLLGPFAHAAPDVDLGCYPHLQRILGRASHRVDGAGDYFTQTARLFGWHDADVTQQPVAAVSRLADGFYPDQAYYLLADPVHLHADQGKVYLTGADSLGVDSAEARTLIEAFNQLYAEDGWHLECFHPQRWYLRLPSAPRIHTIPTAQVLGCAIGEYLPTGEDGLYWHRVMNEIQMLLHVQGVNQQREECGVPTINGLWFWGGGRLPGGENLLQQRLWSDEPWSRGLAILSGSELHDPPSSFVEMGVEPDSIVVLSSFIKALRQGDMPAWQGSLEHVENAWFAPLEEALRNKRLDVIDLYPGNGVHLTITRQGLRRWWKRRPDFAQLSASTD